MSRRIQNEIIRRFFWYVKEMSLGDAFAATLADAENLEELDQVAVVECLLPEIAICFANKYNEMTELYEDPPQLNSVFETFCAFEGLSQDLANVVAITINEGAASLLVEESDDDVDWKNLKLPKDGDEDDVDDEGVVFTGQEWARLSDEERQAKVKAFLKKIAKAHANSRDIKPFLKKLNVGDQENPWGIKVGEKVKMRTSHDPRRTNEATMFRNLFHQSDHEDPRNHPLHNTLKQFAYSYSHTTPVNQPDGSVHNHHTWQNSAGHQIGAYSGKTEWSSKTAASSGHVWTGIGTKALEKHLANKAKRYKHQQVGESELAHGLLESGDQEVHNYLDYINKQPRSWSSVEKTSAAQELRETWQLQDRHKKLFNTDTPQTDAETRGLMNRETK